VGCLATLFLHVWHNIFISRFLLNLLDLITNFILIDMNRSFLLYFVLISVSRRTFRIVVTLIKRIFYFKRRQYIIWIFHLFLAVEYLFLILLLCKWYIFMIVNCERFSLLYLWFLDHDPFHIAWIIKKILLQFLWVSLSVLEHKDHSCALFENASLFYLKISHIFDDYVPEQILSSVGVINPYSVNWSLCCLIFVKKDKLLPVVCSIYSDVPVLKWFRSDWI